MKVLIVAEGIHELGRGECPGALEIMIRRLHVGPIECNPQPVKLNTIHAHHGKSKGYEKKAIRWLLEAQEQGYDALVLLIDEDGRAERLTEINQAQETRLATIRRAMGVAIRTFDAWMLADEQALGRALGQTVQRQKEPEAQPDPKRVCLELLMGGELVITQAEMYAAVAREADCRILEARCPKGFAPFAQRVREL